MTVGQCFNTNTQNKLASCGTPSFPEGNVMHETFLTGFTEALDFTEAEVAQSTSYARPQGANGRLD